MTDAIFNGGFGTASEQNWHTPYMTMWQYVNDDTQLKTKLLAPQYISPDFLIFYMEKCKQLDMLLPSKAATMRI